jgi:hypothetical protein
MDEFERDARDRMMDEGGKDNTVQEPSRESQVQWPLAPRQKGERPLPTDSDDGEPTETTGSTEGTS